MLIGWNGETMPALPLAEELQVAAQAGYGGVELFLPKLEAFLAEHSVQELATRLRATGLAPLTLNGIENITLRPAAEFAQVREETRAWAEVAQAIGCPGIVVVPSPKPEGMAWPEVKAQAVEALQELADIAAQSGVALGFEFLAPASCSVRTLAQAGEIIRATARANARLVLDTYHFVVGGSSWESLEEMDVQSLLVVHINDVEDLPLDRLTDGDRLLPGEGILPLGRLLARLQALGYDGGYSLEVMRPAYRERDPFEYARAGREAVARALAKAR